MTTTNLVVYIFNNETGISKATKQDLKFILSKYDITLADEFSDSVNLIACIGGDGTFLNCVHECDLPNVPIIGINTGHLGFFQDITPNQLEDFIRLYKNGKYEIETIKPIRALITDLNGTHEVIGINEISLLGMYVKLTHLSIIVDDTLIQEFVGDGILVSTPAGSTAYNYSLGGSLVAPQLNALQITPIAPMNTNAYRCFRSSILYPADKTLCMITQKSSKDDSLLVAYDGFTKEFNHISKIEVMQADEEIKLVRLPGYDYWEKLKNKLL